VTDLGSKPVLVDAVIALDMALHQSLADIEEVRRWVDRHGWDKGIARLRRAVELAEPLTESPMETRLRLVIAGGGLPRPQAQVAIHDSLGTFLGRADFLYRAERLILEYDGGTHRESLVEDDRRQNRLVGAGYRLLRFTAADVYGDPLAVVARIRGELAIRRLVNKRTL
jgi:hypothetical protein